MNKVIAVSPNSLSLDALSGETAPRRSYTVAQALLAYQSRLMDSSWVTIRYALSRAASDLGFYDYDLAEVPWNQVDAPVLQELVRRWSADMADSTVKLHVYAVRGLLRSCFTHGLISHLDYLLLDEVRTKGGVNEVGRGQYVEDGIRRELIASCSTDERKTLAARDLALIALLFGSGIRRAEAVNVAIENLDLGRGSFRVTVKGGRYVEKYLAGWAIKPLREWLAVLATQNQTTGPVLRRVSNGGRALADMKPNGLYVALEKRCIFAGVPVIKPHDARRTVATNLINAKGISFARIALGHSSITTTQRYDMTDSDEVRAHFMSQVS